GLELLLTGEMIDASAALQLGLINHIVEPGDELAKAKELIHKISQKGPLAIQKIISTVNAYEDPDTNGFETEIRAFCDLTGTSDFKEGSAAFLEKRQPHFRSV
ncbi:MAG: enoyl-CoA hydratase, partial [Saprospiraceae bacterium]|nr:enoyl-CoA hydratase [Saprospiraceae bacterium]